MTTTKARRVSRRTLLMIIAASALGAWGGLLLFTYYVRPTGMPAILVVFILLALALPSTCVLLTYLVLWIVLTRRGQRPRWLQVLRESGLISAWLLFNLALSALHSWSLFTAIVSFGIIVVVELLVLGQA